MSSCSLRGPSTVLLTGHTLHRTLLQMGVAYGDQSVLLWGERAEGVL